MPNFELRPIGVVDLDTGEHIVSGSPRWAEWLAYVNGHGVAAAQPAEPEPAKAAVMREMSARVNGVRAVALKASTVTVNEIEFDADPASIDALQVVVTRGLAGWKMPAGFTWRATDNSMVPMTPESIANLFAAAVDQRDEIIRKSFDLKDSVIAKSDDPASIDIVGTLMPVVEEAAPVIALPVPTPPVTPALGKP